MSDVEIDLDAVQPVDIEPAKVAEEKDVVFVPLKDGEIRINQDTTPYVKGRAIKVTRDMARILLEANQGYIKE